jgi:D-glycero-alpha-D-manno-heptose-7-phosphate kinase
VIISKTPLRVSFLGGGTDYPEYFRDHGGIVLGTAIDKFAYVSVSRFFSGLFDYSVRISYRQVECVKDIDEIQHAPFRECLRWCGLSKDVEVNYSAELPAFTGLGSSSAFVVGLLNALHAFQGRIVSGLPLAREAIQIERDVLREAVGCQDQVFAAVGGVSLIAFGKDIEVQPVALSADRQRELEEHLLLVYTGTRRKSGEMAARQIKKVEPNRPILRSMASLVEKGHAELVNQGSLSAFGRTVGESWRLKRQLDESIANSGMHSMYDRGLAAGAFGGKLLGAGGGGFLLFIAPPERHRAIRTALDAPPELPVRVGALGSTIIHSDEDWAAASNGNGSH